MIVKEEKSTGENCVIKSQTGLPFMSTFSSCIAIIIIIISIMFIIWLPGALNWIILIFGSALSLLMIHFVLINLCYIVVFGSK